ncbi:MAG: hypothetical protein C0615_02725 [Desulfuromonas sp.]|nr:MAG: hypothetical protein C0615_02725 [Desulfuromonas sp.]
MAKKIVSGLPFIIMITALIGAIVAVGCSEADHKPSMQQVNLKPGLWKITSKVEAPGVKIPMPSTTNTQCLGANDLVPKSNYSGNGCDIVNLRVEGDTITYDVECAANGSASNSNASLTYSGTSMEGMVTTNVTSPTEMKMITQLSGQRIGSCKL